MKKVFMALMAVAAIVIVGCKPKNEPEQKAKPEVKLFYEVRLSGNVTDYIAMDLRYIESPDSNNIFVKQNITSDWMYDEYTVKKGVAATCGLEPSVRVTELFKQLFTDQAKYNTMVASKPKFFVAMGYKTTHPDGHVDVKYLSKDSAELATFAYFPEQMGLTIYTVERNVAQPIACTVLLNEKDSVEDHYLYEFWKRH